MNFLAATPSLASLPLRPARSRRPRGCGAEHWGIAVVSSAITILGITAAAVVYLGDAEEGGSGLRRFMNIFGLYSLSYGKFFFDRIYSLLIVQPLLARRAAGGLVRPARHRRFGGLLRPVAVDAGAALRPVQGGVLQFYALAMALGLLALLGFLLM